MATSTLSSHSVKMAALDEVDVCDNWEDIDVNRLDQKINSLITSHNPAPPKNVRVTVDMSDPIEAQFANHNTAVKILKRPSNTHNGINSNNEGKARPVKSLEQRQQEYEQARLRIMGEARSPEDVAVESISKLQIRWEVPPVTNKIKEKPLPDVQSSPKYCGNRSSSNYTGKIYVNGENNSVNLIRTPKGPDGSKGFLLKR